MHSNKLFIRGPHGHGHDHDHWHGHHGHRAPHHLSAEHDDSDGTSFSGMRGARRGGGGRGGRGHGRLFAQGELQLVLLSLIAKRPSHGYELIKAIEETFSGTYSPSPGAIYPTLTLLEDQGLVTSGVQPGSGSRRLYTITAEGSAYLHDRRDEVAGALARMEMSARAVAGRMPPEAVMQAMHTLKHALAFHASWPEQEIARVSAILQSAAQHIEAGSTPESKQDRKQP